jgi:hypothetical protein
MDMLIKKSSLYFQELEKEVKLLKYNLKKDLINFNS